MRPYRPAASPALDQLVAHAPHRLDRHARVVAQLPPQLVHVHVHRPRAAEELVAPDLLQQQLPRQHVPGRFGQPLEQVELLVAQLQQLVAEPRFVALPIDRQRADRHRRPGRGRRARRAAQDRLHPRRQLARVERLAEVVVRAHLEADDPIHLLRARRQHQDRHVGVLAQLAADVEPALLRHHQVEHDQRRLPRAGRLQRLLAVGGLEHGEALLLQVHRAELADARFVVGHQDRLHRGSSLRAIIAGRGRAAAPRRSEACTRLVNAGEGAAA